MVNVQMETRYLRLTFSLLALSAGLAACGQQAPQGGPPGGAPPVSVAAAIEKEIVESDEFPGRIEAVEQVEVRSRVTGYIQSVNFAPGANVNKGDVLFQIDPRPFDNEIARVDASLANIKVQMDLARIELERAEKLLADRAISRREYDDSASKVRSLDAQLRGAQASLDTARLNRSYAQITAPVAGRVGKAEITVGNLVQGEVPNSPMLTMVVSMDPVYVSFEVDERAYLKYVARSRAKAAQMPLAIGLADEEGFPRPAKLGFVDNRVDVSSGTLRMRAVLPNPDGRLTPGLYARVRIGDSFKPRSAVLVVDRAIGTDQSKRFVLVVNGDNKADYRPVKIGRLVDGLRVIEDGLKAGEKIVVNGLQRVRPGTAVTPEVVSMTGGDKPAPAADAKAAPKAEEKGGK
jgi:multidrug efflux system membrane fusion protein